MAFALAGVGPLLVLAHGVRGTDQLLLQSLICTIFYGDFYGDGLGFLGQTGGILVCLW